MTNLEVLPCAQLRPYVHLIWCLELDSPGACCPPERIAPDGVVEAVFHYRDPMAARFAGEGEVVQPRSSVVTLTRRFLEICPRGDTGFLSVRFWPWGAHHFLGLPISQIADRIVLAEDLWGAVSREIEERLAAPIGVVGRVALVEEFLTAQLRTRRRASVEVEPLIRAVWRRRGDIRVAELCAEIGLTERSVERAFASAVGMAPRSFIRLTRFLHACSKLRSGAETNLTRLAHDCGYYDQSHFVADVRAYSGMTPGQLVAAPLFSFLEPE